MKPETSLISKQKYKTPEKSGVRQQSETGALGARLSYSFAGDGELHALAILLTIRDIEERS